MILKNTRVLRGNYSQGVSEERTPTETTFDVRDFKRLSITFRHSINSKGGGITLIHLEVGKEDWPLIFREMLRQIPESAEWFREMAALADERSL